MSEPVPPLPRPQLSLSQISTLLGNPARWIILRELSREPALPVNELARRAGLTPGATSKHMALMTTLGAVTTGYGRLYSLTPAFRPAPGTLDIDLGPCLLRLAHPTP